MINNYLIIYGLIVIEFVLLTVFHVQTFGQISRSENQGTDFNITSLNKYPIGIAIDPSIHKVCVTSSNQLLVINRISNKLMDNITLDYSPRGIAIDPIKHKIYTTDPEHNSILVINGISNKLMDNITLDYSPRGIAIDPSIHKVYVINYKSDIVSIVDERITLKRYSQLNNLDIGIKVDNPTGIAIDPTIHKAYVTSSNLNFVSVIDELDDKVIGNPIQVGSSPRGIAIDPTIHKVYVANSASNTISVIDGITNELQIGIRFNVGPNSNSGYIKCNGNTTTTNQYFY